MLLIASCVVVVLLTVAVYTPLLARPLLDEEEVLPCPALAAGKLSVDVNIANVGNTTFYSSVLAPKTKDLTTVMTGYPRAEYAPSSWSSGLAPNWRLRHQPAAAVVVEAAAAPRSSGSTVLPGRSRSEGTMWMSGLTVTTTMSTQSEVFPTMTNILRQKYSAIGCFRSRLAAIATVWAVISCGDPTIPKQGSQTQVETSLSVDSAMRAIKSRGEFIDTATTAQSRRLDAILARVPSRAVDMTRDILTARRSTISVVLNDTTLVRLVAEYYLTDALAESTEPAFVRNAHPSANASKLLVRVVIADSGIGGVARLVVGRDGENSDYVILDPLHANPQVLAVALGMVQFAPWHGSLAPGHTRTVLLQERDVQVAVTDARARNLSGILERARGESRRSRSRWASGREVEVELDAKNVRIVNPGNDG